MFWGRFGVGFEIVLGTVWGSVVEIAEGPQCACGCSQAHFWAIFGSVRGSVFGSFWALFGVVLGVFWGRFWGHFLG